MSCSKNTPKEEIKDLCYGAAIIYFEPGRVYTRQEKENIIAHDNWACKDCKDKLTHEEQLICIQ